MRNERGIALVFVLFLVTTISALAVSLTFLAQSETFASGNYRMATQTRYAAESGAQKASDFLLDSTQYNPGTLVALIGPGGVDNNVSPVTYLGNPVVLSALGTVGSNYPDATVKTAFNVAAGGNLTAGSTTISYGAYATLLHMDSFGDAYGGGTTVVQTWQITSDGMIRGGVRDATVEITSTIETPKVPAFQYAAFATANGCGALTFNGNTGTDSYNSAFLGGVAPTSCPAGTTGPTCFKSDGGDVGTNGNMLIDGGSVDVNGNLSTPRTGVGACTAGNVTALSGALTVNGGTPIQLPKAVTLPTPSIPTPAPGGAL